MDQEKLDAARAAIAAVMNKKYDYVAQQSIRQESGVRQELSFASQGIEPDFAHAADIVRQFYAGAPSRMGVNALMEARDSAEDPSLARKMLAELKAEQKQDAADTLGLVDSLPRFDAWMQALNRISRPDVTPDQIDDTTKQAMQRGKELLQAIVLYSRREQQTLEAVGLNPRDKEAEYDDLLTQSIRRMRPTSRRLAPAESPKPVNVGHLDATALVYLRHKLYCNVAEDLLGATSLAMEALNIPSLPEPKLPTPTPG